MRLRIALLAFLVCALSLNAQESPKRVKINDNWLVNGEVKDIPYDLAASAPVRMNYLTGQTYKDYGEGNPTFTRALDLSLLDKEGYVGVLFEGLDGHSKVYVNGTYLGGATQPNVPYVFELTPYLGFDGKDTLSVSFAADCPQMGIVQDVYLLKKDEVHFANDGVRALQIISDGKVELRINSKVENTSHSSRNIVVRHVLIDSKGAQAATVSSLPAETGARRLYEQELVLSVPSPQLWYPSNPAMYTLVSTVLENNIPVDETSCAIGFRTLDYLQPSGFLLNGSRFDVHPIDFDQSYFLGGNAVPASYLEYCLAELKKQGCNMISTGGKPASEVVLNACDRLGIFVVDQVPVLGVNPEQMDAAAAMVAKAANHPSVIYWGVSGDGPEGLSRTFAEVLRSLDYSRKVAVLSPGEGHWHQGAENYIFETEPFASSIGGRELATWSTQPAVYMEPEWSMSGKEGKSVTLTVYSNCERVNLGVNGAGYSSKDIVDGKAEWTVTYKPGHVDLVGYNKNKAVVRKTYNTAGFGYQIKATPDKLRLKGDGQDIIVIDIQMLDSKGNPTTDSNLDIRAYVDNNALSAYGVSSNNNNIQFAPIEIMGAPGEEQVTFPVKDGKSRVVIRSVKGASGIAHIRIGGDSLHGATFNINYE
jgi:hypothetical protein